MADSNRNDVTGWMDRFRKGIVKTFSGGEPTLKGAAFSDAGSVRENNEDTCLFTRLESGSWLAAVADGVGGHERGEVASQHAIRSLESALVEADPESKPGHLISFLTHTLVSINEQLDIKNREMTGKGRMGTTLTCFWLIGRTVLVGHVGDTRLYRLRDAALDRLTVDQSESGRLFASGQITEAEERAFPGRNIIEQALGISAQRFQPEVYAIQPKLGDRYLICSDGLVNGLVDEQIEAFLNDSTEANEELAKRLVDLAIERSGRDNTTTVVFDYLLDE